MTKFRAIALLVFLACSFSVSAAEPEAKRHWYEVAIQVGGSKISYTGSSSFDALQMKKLLADGTAFVELENPSMNVDGSKLYVRTTAVIYFIELPTDPNPNVNK